jgi:hypothetical protein
MATISSSQIIEDVKQVDGRRWILERHIDNAGIERLVRYLAAAGDDTAALLATHAAQVAANLAAGEVAANVAVVTALGSAATPTFTYSTVAQNAAGLREAYRGATRIDAVMVGDYLDTLSSAQLQAAFGLTAGQVATLKTNKLDPAASLATQVRVVAGQ